MAEIMAENMEKLAVLFSGIDKQISMTEFDDKLKVQKIAYLAQESGIDLGYEFDWYLRGPYCKQVSQDAHSIIDQQVESTSEQTGLNKEKIANFAKKIEPYKHDTEWLEIAASLYYIRKEHYHDREFDEIVGYLFQDLSYGYKNFSESLVRKILIDLVKLNLIQ